MKRTATAVWMGDLKKGKGSLTTQSKTLSDTQYGFQSRFESGTGTNPEELIAAAHAGCFTMAFSAFLGKAGFTTEKLSTEAALSFDQVKEDWTITTIDLNLTGRVPNIDEKRFLEIANEAKEKCPVSRLLKAKINLNAKLEK